MPLNEGYSMLTKQLQDARAKTKSSITRLEFYDTLGRGGGRQGCGMDERSDCGSGREGGMGKPPARHSLPAVYSLKL